jgi:putative ABC transport system permease protein
MELSWIFGAKKKPLIGIVDYVLMGSPYQEVKPMFMLLDDWDGAMTIRIRKTENLPSALKTIENVFKKYNASYPFEYTFADVEFQKKFSTIKMTSSLASLFATLTILITGLGLFGLAAYTAEQRTKEIGIRKVMGATVVNIIALISKSFSLLVIISFTIAAPVAWWLLNLYLDRYPIRIEMQLWIFPLTGIIALLFALAIVSTQAVRAALANPVNSLRNE